MTIRPFNHSLQHMLEAVEELIALLETEKSLLLESEPVPEELLERLRIAGDGVSEVVATLRASGTPEPSEELRELKARLQERFVVAFRLTKETEKLIKEAPAAARPNPQVTEKARLSLSEVEKQYRARMRLGKP